MDLYHYYGNDLTVNHLGDLGLASGIILSQQRILRRLLTPPGSYIWDLGYGAGIGSYVGLPLDSVLKTQIQGVITAQMLLETSVSQTPPPVITLTANQNFLFCTIQYIDASTNTLETLSFNVSS